MKIGEKTNEKPNSWKPWESTHTHTHTYNLLNKIKNIKENKKIAIDLNLEENF